MEDFNIAPIYGLGDKNHQGSLRKEPSIVKLMNDTPRAPGSMAWAKCARPKWAQGPWA